MLGDMKVEEGVRADAGSLDLVLSEFLSLLLLNCAHVYICLSSIEFDITAGLLYFSMTHLRLFCFYLYYLLSVSPLSLILSF